MAASSTESAIAKAIIALVLLAVLAFVALPELTHMDWDRSIFGSNLRPEK